MRTISIPRLELLAASLAATIEHTLRTELSDMYLSDTIFWSDSEIGLANIRNTSRILNVFVANRISTIHETTQPTQWHHIAGCENPSDLTT